MAAETLVPVPGCWVRRRDDPKKIPGHVLEKGQRADGWSLKVGWPSGQQWVPLAELEAGFTRGWSVQDLPVSTTRRTLGPGTVVGSRRIAGCDQILVQLDSDGRSVWLPYENLKRIKGARLRYERVETGRVRDHAERFRLRLLAHALESWNQLTGALDRLDVDPLPHQIQLVYRILSSGHHNWLIADDVGLGKTIEVGLLLAALKRRGQARRVLVVAPAGLTAQWQAEMKYKFGETYRIYSRDFTVSDPEHWKLYDHVVVSLDLAKREDHMQIFAQAPAWDVVVFDEGHKLTRYASGERADRYRLAEMLRPNADAFLLLSGTPHQGYADRFLALLELVRPDLSQEIHTMAANPEIVAEMILRNRKTEVTDADGNFIFKGQNIRRVAVKPSKETERFQRMLHTYLTSGYKAGETQGAAGRAIGFVMTTYRKLASSSIAAIERALRLRLERLTAEVSVAQMASTAQDMAPEELAEGGDEQYDLDKTITATSAHEFFAYEVEQIRDLLAVAAEVRKNDEKLRLFLTEVVEPVVQEGKKLLVFTEYRATQTYLKEAIEQHFADAGAVVQINGSMNLDEKLAAIQAFNDAARFMVSTEAGGEGINLHHACHVMVNYDLPWNPARLIQRIGRLYRYGQQHTVIVYNLHAQDTFDNQAIDLMLQRVMQIVQDMAPVGEDYHDRLYAEILGDLLDRVDLASVLQSTTTMQIARTRQQIDEALQRAQEAQRLQREIFSHIPGFDPNALRGTVGFTMEHVSRFIEGMLPVIGATLSGKLHGGKLLEIRLPDELRGRFLEFGQRTNIRVTTDRRLAQRLHDAFLLDFEAPFFQRLIELAKEHDFDGQYASIASAKGIEGTLAAFRLRWQTDQGEPVLEEFVPVFQSPDGRIEANPPFLVDWLVSPLGSAAPPNADGPARRQRFAQLHSEAERRLATESTKFKHPNGLVALAAADIRLGS